MASSMLEGRPEGLSSVGLFWIKSSLSYCNSNCVEVASLPDGEVGVRDSKDPSGPVLRFTPGEWHAFWGGARNGDFEVLGGKLENGPGPPSPTLHKQFINKPPRE